MQHAEVADERGALSPPRRPARRSSQRGAVGVPRRRRSRPRAPAPTRARGSSAAMRADRQALDLVERGGLDRARRARTWPPPRGTRRGPRAVSARVADSSDATGAAVDQDRRHGSSGETKGGPRRLRGRSPARSSENRPLFAGDPARPALGQSPPMADDLIDIAAAREVVLGTVQPAADPSACDCPTRSGASWPRTSTSAEDMPPFDSSALDGYVVGDTGGGDLPVVGESRAGAPGRAALRGRAGDAHLDRARPCPRAASPSSASSAREAQRRPRRPPAEPRRREHPPRRRGRARRRARAQRRRRPRARPSWARWPRSAAPRSCAAPQPRVAVLTTGDELVEPGAGPLAPGQIRNSNAYALAAQAQRAGARVVAREIVRDDREHTIADAARRARGRRRRDRLRRRVGRPARPREARARRARRRGALLAGRAQAGQADVVRHPRATSSCSGCRATRSRRSSRSTCSPGPRCGGWRAATRTTRARRRVLDVPYRARARSATRCCAAVSTPAPDGWHVAPTKPQGSHVLTSMLGAGALALVPRGEGELPAGSGVDIELLR